MTTCDTIETEDTITINYDGNHVYRWYPNQIEPQLAYVEMDELGYVSVYRSDRIGDDMPADVWLGVRLWWQIPSESSPYAIYDLFAQHRDLFASVHAGHIVERDSTDRIGHLTDAARAASEELDLLCGELDCLDVWKHEDWWAESVKVVDNTLTIDGTDIQLSSESPKQAIQSACSVLDSLTHAHPLTELVIGHASDWLPDMVATLCD